MEDVGPEEELEARQLSGQKLAPHLAAEGQVRVQWGLRLRYYLSFSSSDVSPRPSFRTRRTRRSRFGISI